MEGYAKRKIRREIARNILAATPNPESMTWNEMRNILTTEYQRVEAMNKQIYDYHRQTRLDEINALSK